MKKPFLIFGCIFVTVLAAMDSEQGKCWDCGTPRASQITQDEYDRLCRSHKQIGGAHGCYCIFCPFCLPCLHDWAYTLLRLRLFEQAEARAIEKPVGCCGGEASWYAGPIIAPVCDDGMCLLYWGCCQLKGPCCCCLGRELCKNKARVCVEEMGAQK